MAMTLIEGLTRVVRSPGFKFFLVCFLILLLGIPLTIVWLLTQERQDRANTARSEIAQHWGAKQALQGPYLVVPYSVKVFQTVDDKKTFSTHERYAIFLPEKLEVTGDTSTEVRRRSIYDTTVYTAKMKLSGKFSSPNFRNIEQGDSTIRWRDAFIALSISDVSGLKESAELVVNNKHVPFEPSLGLPGVYRNGINARLNPEETAKNQALKPFDFSIDLVFAGSSALQIAPAGRETHVELKSDWPHPSFIGAFLPVSHDLRSDGFKATWRVPHLARSVPQAWAINANSGGAFNKLTSYTFGVNYFQPIDYFNLVNRAAKYGMMFLSVAFLAVFTLELTSSKRVHPVQYVFVGLAMILFYILLLSLSEHIGFLLAYIIASCATGGMLSLYVGMALSNRMRGLIMLGIFLVLYTLLYLILRLQDYALLAGAIAGFVMLTVTMFATLRINWSSGEPATSGR
ncbi:MAG: cell envelope integrity protein CreD [Alphaproteobacteria bacterium]